MNDAILRPYDPDDRAWLVERHQTLYAHDEGFDDTFGPLVDGILQAFEAQFDPERERGWIAEAEGRRLGSIFCVRQTDDTAKLRMFLLDPAARGRGLGQRLLSACMDFARASGYRDMVLWTHESHRAACALYARNGWRIDRSEPVHSFGVDLVEQSWSVRL